MFRIIRVKRVILFTVKINFFPTDLVSANLFVTLIRSISKISEGFIHSQAFPVRQNAS